VTSPTSEYGSLLAGSTGRRSAPGSIQPFDANMLDRATRTLQSAQSWNAFDAHPALPAAASAPVEAEIVEDEPGRREQIRQEPARPYDAGTPVAGRHPAAMPELPAGPIEMKPVTPPFPPVVIPRPRTAPEAPSHNGRSNGNAGSNGNAAGNGNGLRRRVPGNQLPADIGPKAPIAPPTTDDAVAAREAFEAFEAGVSRAQWDVIEAEVNGTPAPGPARDSHPPLARRTPGASLPDVQPQHTTPPPASPSRPLDPNAARALVEQFEYGVALALNESKNQHEGQSR
jgi:hypothetical protein